MVQIELNHGFLSLLFFAFMLHIYAELNSLKYNCFDICRSTVWLVNIFGPTFCGGKFG